MQHQKRGALPLLGLIVLSLSLAACGETAPTPTAAPPPTPAPVVATATAAAAPTAPRLGPVVSPIPEGTIAPAPESQIGAAPGGPILVSAADLKAGPNEPRLRLVDMGSAAEYAAGHAPGAVHIDWRELQVTD